MKAALPLNEIQRLAALREYGILDTPPEREFDDIAALARLLCKTPFALITFVDEKRQWFKSSQGIDFRETSRDLSFCAHALHEAELLVVEDCTLDPRFLDNPLVTTDPKIRFYAGAPLLTQHGEILGTLCVLDTQVRVMTREERQALRSLAGLVGDQLEHRRAQQRIATAIAGQERAEVVLRQREAEGRKDREDRTKKWRAQSERRALLTALCYAAFAALWIVASDRVLAQLGPAWNTHSLQTTKGLLFVTLTAAGLYFIISRYLGARGAAELARQANEDRYRSLVMATSQIVWNTDARGAMRSESPTWESHTGQSFAQTINWGWLEMVHPDDRDRIRQTWQTALASGKAFETEFQVRNRQGIYHVFSVRGVPVVDESGEIQEWVGVCSDITERKVVANRLAQSEERYRLLLNNLPDYAVFMLNPEGEVTTWNEGARPIMGYTGSEIIGRNHACFFEEEAIAQGAPQQLLLRARHEGSVETEGWRMRKDGSRFCANVIITPVYGPEGQLRGFAIITRDVTLRRNAEIALRQSEERYRHLVELSPDAVFVISQCEIIFCNQAACELLGVGKPEALIGRAFPEFASEASRPMVQAFLARDLSSINKLQIHELSLSRSDGRRVDVRIACAPFDLEGRPAMQCIAHDITLNKAMLMELRASEERFRLLSLATDDAVYDWNLNTGAIWWNEAYHTLFGYDDNPQGQTIDFWESCVHPEDRERVVKALDAVIAEGGNVWSAEYRFRRADNSYAFIHDRGYIVANGSKPERMIGAMTDITERKTYENQLKQTGEELRALSSHLETVREEERARIAREIHDELGQALTSLKMDLSWVGKRVNDRPHLYERLQAMTHLINATVGAVRRISSELRPAILDNFGLPAAIEWQVAEFQKRTGIECRFLAPQRDFQLSEAQIITLFRIAQEALTNVARHAEASYVEVQLSIEGPTVILEVADDGRGIGDAETEPTFGVMGMRERAALLGGSFRLQRRPNGGTQLRAALPLFTTAPESK